MIRNLSTELKVGLLILSGIGIIVYSSVLVTGWRPGQADTYRVWIYMDNVAGLLVGSPAQTAGIKIGEVTTIELEEGQAKVGVDVFNRYRLYADARASIKSLGILGDKYIDVVPGTPTQPRMEDGDTIIFVLPGGDLDNLVDTTSKILQDVQAVTATLRHSLGGPAGQEKLDTLVNALVAASENLQQITEATNRRIDGIMTNLAAFSGGLERVMSENEQALGNTAQNLEQLTANLNRISADNEAGIKATIGNLAGFSEELQALTAENRAALDRIIADLGTFSESLATDGPEITRNVRGILEENRAELKTSVSNLDVALANLSQVSADLRDITAENREEVDRIVESVDTFTTDLALRGPQITSDLGGILEENRNMLNTSVANLDRSLSRLDGTMANLEEVTGRIERGEGSLGRLINDDETVEELNSALSGINEFLTQVNRLRIEIGGHTEYLTRQDDFKTYVNLKLQPLKNRYYLIQLVDDPRGDVTETVTETRTTGTDPANNRTKEVETTEELQLSLLVAQRYYDTVVKGGLMENTFGIGVEQLFGSTDAYSIGLDVWDFGNTFGPHAKVTAYWRFFSNAFVLVGYDDFLSENEEFRDAFFGVGVNFTEDNLKPLFSSLPIGSATGTN